MRGTGSSSEHARLTGVDFLERPSSISRRILATAFAIRRQPAPDEVLAGFGAELPACPLGRDGGDGARPHHGSAPIILPAARWVARGRQWLLRRARPAQYYAPDPAQCATAASPARIDRAVRAQGRRGQFAASDVIRDRREIDAEFGREFAFGEDLGHSSFTARFTTSQGSQSEMGQFPPARYFFCECA